MTSAYSSVRHCDGGEDHGHGRVIDSDRPGLPAHFCGRCMGLVYQRDRRCLECGRARPQHGWESLSVSGDPWLGRIMSGRYLITRRLGKGASATVYEAESLNISRKFAIKVVDLNACDGDKDPHLIRARLERELKATSRLTNPHTVPFYEVISLSETCVGIVMKFIHGQTLDDVLVSESPLDWRRTIRLLRQIAIGVHEAHTAGLIHRDLKPANIMVEELSAGEEFVYVLDFGIVWMDDGVEVTCGFVGTPLYASPEQALGDHVDRRSDIYALGAIFFEMLTGRPPFQSNDIIEVLRMHVGRKPPRLEQVDVPDEVQELVDCMLSKKREARPFELSDVIAQLDALVYTSSPQADVADTSRSNPPARSAGRSPDVGRTADGLGVLESMRHDRVHAETIDTLISSELKDADSQVSFDKPQIELGSLGSPPSFYESAEHDATGPKAAILTPRFPDAHPSLRPQSR